MMLPSIQKMHFPLLFLEHQYLAYRERFTHEIVETYSQHPDLVTVSQIFYLGPSFCFMKSRKIIQKNNIRVSRFVS